MLALTPDFVAHKRVLLRLDLDLPESGPNQFDTTRLEDSLETIALLYQSKAEHVTVIAHRGRPDGYEPQLSLKPISDLLFGALLNHPQFQGMTPESAYEWINVEENLRFDSREEKADLEFAKELAHNQDVFVNDAFATSHRAHTSMVMIPKVLPSAIGLRFAKELDALNKVTTNPERPVVFLLGGAKLETKLPLIERVSHHVDQILLGGKLALEAQETGFAHPKVLVAQLTDDTLDISTASIVMFTHLLSSAKTIIWNGPMGKFEDGHTAGTQAVAEAIQKSQAYSLIGGGDTEAAVTQLGIDESTAFDHVSTGGGAMMAYLAEQRLPALDALSESQQPEAAVMLEPAKETTLIPAPKEQPVLSEPEMPQQTSQFSQVDHAEFLDRLLTKIKAKRAPTSNISSEIEQSSAQKPAYVTNSTPLDTLPRPSAPSVVAPAEREPMRNVRPTFGINGFGRIGRTSFRVWWQKHRDRIDLKLINTSGSMDIEDWAMLLKYDSNYGQFSEPISVERIHSTKEVTEQDPVLGHLKVGGRRIVITAQRDPAKIPWGAYQVDTVIESTGVFISADKAKAHLDAGAKKVIISAPGKGPNVPTSVISVKEAGSDKIISNASCTTNCVAPVVQVISMAFGIAKASMTTIHSYTDDQNLHDNSHKDLRRARAAAINIVPTSTGAAVATTEVIPELKGLFHGLAIRVPTPVGSLSDIVFITKQKTTVEQVNEVLTLATKDPRFEGILAVTNDPIVSSDIRGRSESSIVDLSLTQVIDGDLVKVIAWYDNEFGYCNRLIEQVGRAE